MLLNNLSVIIQIIFLDGILSVDNAAVLGAMVEHLPAAERIPWPRPLRFLSRPAHRLLGGQRSAALKVGLLGAYLGRALMLVCASVVIRNPWLKLLGGLYLVKLAFDNLGEEEAGKKATGHSRRAQGRPFWAVVALVELTDLAFSLDNVVAIIALTTDLALILGGIVLSIIMMRFAAGIFTTMISKEPILKPAAYVLVLNIGLELLIEEQMARDIPDLLKFGISMLTLILALLYAHVRPLHTLRPVLRWVGEGMAHVNALIDWGLRPVIALFGLAIRLALHMIQALSRLNYASPALANPSDPPKDHHTP